MGDLIPHLGKEKETRMIGFDSTRAGQAMTLLLALWVVLETARPVDACTTVMVGRQATEDRSVLMASSCDGVVVVDDPPPAIGQLQPSLSPGGIAGIGRRHKLLGAR
jgi:hypothetical protein